MPGILRPSRRFYESTYTEEVLATDPIAHWTLGERFGATAYDTTQNHFNGAITGATLGQPGIGDGLTSMFFDGANDFVNLLPGGIAAAFNGLEGTYIVWGQVFSAAVWADTVARYLIRFFVDANNGLFRQKTANVNQMWSRYTANGIDEDQLGNVIPSIDWVMYALTWSRSTGADGEVRHYIDGVQDGATDTALGNWAGIPIIATIGAATAVPASVWHGYLAHPAVWTRPLPPSEVALLYHARWTR